MTELERLPDNLSAALWREVERYLAATGMGPTPFGVAAVRDGTVVGRLRQGRVTLRTAERVRAFMREHPPVAAEAQGRAAGEAGAVDEGALHDGVPPAGGREAAE